LKSKEIKRCLKVMIILRIVLMIIMPLEIFQVVYDDVRTLNSFTESWKLIFFRKCHFGITWTLAVSQLIEKWSMELYLL
jgi:hypothetical protein